MEETYLFSEDKRKFRALIILVTIMTYLGFIASTR